MPAKKKQTQPKFSRKGARRTIITSIIIAILMILVAFIVTLPDPKKPEQKENPEAQKARLDSTADDLEALYEKILSKIPSLVAEKHFKKDCSDSSRKFSTSYECGAEAGIVVRNVSDIESIKQLVGQAPLGSPYSWRKGKSSSGSVDTANYKYDYNNYELRHVNGTKCRQYLNIFNDVAAYQKYTGSEANLLTPIAEIYILCTETVGAPIYPLNKES